MLRLSRPVLTLRASGVQRAAEALKGDEVVLKPKQARRVRRELHSCYMILNDFRMNISYKGGWQNGTQKAQWIWYYFKKYGLLGNFACFQHMREIWVESGEKRLTGMDALGHKYWESDEMSRHSECAYRWVDMPHQILWSDYAKLPQEWETYRRQHIGRSPGQWEQLHRELGPEWRDYMRFTVEGRYTRPAQEDTWWCSWALDMDAGGMGVENTSPFDPQMKQLRWWYGHDPSRNPSGREPGQEWSTKNAYDVDRYDPVDGARDWLELERNLSPDRLAQDQMWHAAIPEGEWDTSGNTQTYNRNSSRDSSFYHQGTSDGGKWASEMWWEFRIDSAEKNKASNEYVSAFDMPEYSKANTSYGRISEFGYGSRYRDSYQGQLLEWQGSGNLGGGTLPLRQKAGHEDSSMMLNYWKADPSKVGGSSHSRSYAGKRRRW